MKLRSLLRAAIIAVCASLLLFVNRPATHHLPHPYPAPEFELRDLKGDQVRLSEFREKAAVRIFWETRAPHAGQSYRGSRSSRKNMAREECKSSGYRWTMEA